MDEKKFTVTLTAEQVAIILGLIDDHTVDQPDFFLNDNGRVYTPLLDPEYKNYEVTVQEHLDRFLDREKLEY